jgi:hypothetical protein
MIKVSIDRQVMHSVMSGVANQIKSKFDLNHIKKLCKKLYGIETIEGVKHKDANIVVIENQVGCKLDLEVRFSMSVFISTKENSNSTLPENNGTTGEFNEMTGEFDEMMTEFDEMPEEFDEMEAEFDVPEELDIQEEFDNLLEEELNDDMVRLKEQPRSTRTTKNGKNSS